MGTDGKLHAIRNDVSRIYSKLGVSTRAAAVVWARERGVGERVVALGV